MNEAIWNMKDVNIEEAREMAFNLDISEGLAKVCLARNINEDNYANVIDLSPSKIHSFMSLPDVKPAVKRIIQALENNEKIFIHGDYDVDGVTATAVVIYTLRKLGGNISYHVPHRVHDGYDIKEPSVDRALRAQADLMISVDCGILAFKAADYAKENNLDLIITDHHTPADNKKVPDCLAVINPARHDSEYPFSGLAGVGIAFKLMCAVALKYKQVKPKQMLGFLSDLVALGTVADVAPMIDENRVLVSLGCKNLQTSKKPGIKELIKVSRIQGDIDTMTIGFQLGPRINAVGRMGDSMQALELLVANSDSKAKRLAKILDETNKHRQKQLKQCYDEALSMLPDDEQMKNTYVIVMGAHNWHSGLVGLIAGKLTEKYGRPTMIYKINDDGTAKGSCRSVPSFHILNAMKSPEIASLFNKFGGHAQAAGFEIPIANLKQLKVKINQYAQDNWEIADKEDFKKILDIDAMLYPHEINETFYNELKILAPFGSQNPQPVFATKNLKVIDIKQVGKENDHLRLKLTPHNTHSGAYFTAMWWRHGHDADNIAINDSVNIAYTLNQEHYMGKTSLGLIIEDLQKNL